MCGNYIGEFDARVLKFSLKVERLNRQESRVFTQSGKTTVEIFKGVKSEKNIPL